MQAFYSRLFPVRRETRVLERNAAIGEVLRKTAPGSKIELLCTLDLLQIIFQPRALGEQPEDASLIKNVDLVFPNHVIDRREFLPIADEGRSQSSESILHECNRQGTSTETAKPVRYTG